METTHHTAHEERARPREDWFDEDYIDYWLDREKSRDAERSRQFILMRALLPKMQDETFRYINLGAGPGNLDEVLLDYYPGAEAVLVDGSMPMLAEARRRLERFEGRVEFVQANLATGDWLQGVSGPFDVAVSTIALHNLRDPRRLRQLYAEVCDLLGHGGVFLNLDYVRLARPALRAFGAKAGTDPDAGIVGSGHGGSNSPGTVGEQLTWLREGGFAVADCLWQELSVAILCGVHDHIHLPGAEEAQGGHAHGEHAHAEHGGHADHDHAAHGHGEHAAHDHS